MEAILEERGQTRALPEGWRWVRLGEVCEVISKGTTPTTNGHSFTDTGIPFLRAENINGGPVDNKSVSFHISPDTHEYLSRSKLVPGDILITIAGTLGRVGYIPQDAPPMNCNQAVAFARPKKNILHIPFVCLALRSYNVISPLIDLKAGGAILNLNLGQVRSLKIPLPPLAEQKRIAGILNEQMAAVERARTSTEAQLEAAKALPAAYLREVFNSPEARTWPKKIVSEICKKIDYGYTASANSTIKEPFFLRITDIQNGLVNWKTVPGCIIDEKEEKANLLSDGDIVFARTGATTGKSFLIKNPPRAVFASYLIRLQAKEEINPEYLYQFFQSDQYWKQIKAFARGGAQPNVNASLLGRLIVPIPQIAEQTKVVARLIKKINSVNMAIKALEERLNKINKLPAALLRRAFNGEL